ncbi:hypothetical protein F4814DRAFT_452867 [Daldinia grandis]|nr:hypothetical protein F4814DRAFT_452867 [Daldinia grandis]
MSAYLRGTGDLFQAPEVSQEEIGFFHDAHFSLAATKLFNVQFLRPENVQDKQDEYQFYEEYEEYYEENDDGLGYYPDGVKRTLTDEQIAIFRHSEIEALRRAKTRSAKLGETSTTPSQVAEEDDSAPVGEPNPDSTAVSLPTMPDESHDQYKEKEGEAQNGSEDGEIEEEMPKPTEAEVKREKKQRARRKKYEQRKFHPEKKPDLRKRTWDVVETGMDSLYYDDETAQDTAAAPAAQRRRISYDD